MIKHLGIIMDGNRRYAKKNGISLDQGYKKGMEKFLEFVSFQVKYNISETSFFALSSDNYGKRPESELKTLFSLMKYFSENKEIEEFFLTNKIQINLRGEVEKTIKTEKKNKTRGPFITQLLEWKENLDKQIKKPKFKVNIALNYDGQKELVHAMKEIASKVESGELKKSSINEKTIKKHLWFNDSSVPEVIIRPGDAPRLSGFMLWDSQYSELYLTRKLWPELGEADFTEILSWYKGLKRNFGK